MPTYEYRCKDCGHTFDAYQSFTDDALTECPECEGALKKLFGNVGISFKGSGFYKTDSRAGAKSGSSSSSSETTKTSSDDSGSSTNGSKDSKDSKGSDSSPSTPSTSSTDKGAKDSGSTKATSTSTSK